MPKTFSTLESQFHYAYRTLAGSYSYYLTWRNYLAPISKQWKSDRSKKALEIGFGKGGLRVKKGSLLQQLELLGDSAFNKTVAQVPF